MGKGVLLRLLRWLVMKIFTHFLDSFEEESVGGCYFCIIILVMPMLINQLFL